jgi:short-chain Z-isoprenyl diphosphate synthase
MLKKTLEVLGAYKIYEYWLSRQIKGKPIPSHVGIILDGNRRWAKQKHLIINLGHNFGARVAEESLNWAEALGIKDRKSVV